MHIDRNIEGLNTFITRRNQKNIIDFPNVLLEIAHNHNDVLISNEWNKYLLGILNHGYLRDSESN